MKSKLFFLPCVLAAAVSCADKASEIELIPSASFEQTVDGKNVSLYTLKAGDLTMQVTNFGGRVVSLWVPDRDGHYEDIVLGYPELDTYLNNPGERFLGAAVGPYANRIANGKFVIDGQEYTLPQNNNGQTLHGGLKGIDMVVWDVDECNDSTVVFSYVHPDGQDGFPGNIKIKMTYSLDSDNEFKVTYEAVTDRPVYLNLSHHSFFNLKGEGNGTILDNILNINADSFIPVDPFLIPTGEIADVEGTPFDFRTPHAIGDMIGEENEQLKNSSGYDHNWVIDRKTDSEMEFAASLYEPASGRFLEVFSDQPGLQFYCGNFFDGTTSGKYGRTLNYRESVALETQKFPDSPNHPQFPDTRLDPGETYTHTCIYRFSCK